MPPCCGPLVVAAIIAAAAAKVECVLSTGFGSGGVAAAGEVGTDSGADAEDAGDFGVADLDPDSDTDDFGVADNDSGPDSGADLDPDSDLDADAVDEPDLDSGVAGAFPSYSVNLKPLSFSLYVNFKKPSLGDRLALSAIL